MPCWSRIEVQLGVTWDLGVLERGLRAAGLAPRRYDARLVFGRDGEHVYEAGTSGTLLLAASGEAAAALERTVRAAYTREAVATAARRQGLRVEVDARDPAVLRLRTDGRTA